LKKIISIAGPNGGTFDVKPYFGGSAFKELRDKSYFHLVRPAHHGIMWPNEQDFSSDTIVWDICNARTSKPNREKNSGCVNFSGIQLSERDSILF